MNPIVLDGANVAWNYGKNTFPHVKGIYLASESLTQQGYTVIIVLNARYHDLWPNEIQQLSSIENVFVPPSILDSKSDDRIMIDFATNKGCKILSNDRFRDHVNSLPKAKRANAKNWINSEVLQFHFGENGFTLGPDSGDSHLSAVKAGELAKWMAGRIKTNHDYSLNDVIGFFLEFYDQSISDLPTRREFRQALQLGPNARIDRIIKSLLAPQFIGIGQYDGKIDFSLRFQERSKLSLNFGVVDECERQLRGILHSNWVPALSLSHQLNVGLGNTLGRRVNSDTIKRHLGVAKTTTFRELLMICLGDEIKEFEIKTEGKYQQWYGLITDQVPKPPIEIKLKRLLKEVREQNYSVLNIPISTLVPEFDELVGMEDLWRAGIRRSEMAKLVLDNLGKTVKTLFGSVNDMVCVVNQWHHGGEHWYFDSDGRLFETNRS